MLSNPDGRLLGRRVPISSAVWSSPRPPIAPESMPRALRRAPPARPGSRNKGPKAPERATPLMNPDPDVHRVSHGCIRFNNENARELMHMVEVGTPVLIY